MGNAKVDRRFSIAEFLIYMANWGVILGLWRLGWQFTNGSPTCFVCFILGGFILTFGAAGGLIGWLIGGRSKFLSGAKSGLATGTVVLIFAILSIPFIAP